LSDLDPPDCFFYAGGSATVIERSEGGPGGALPEQPVRNVLLALPEWVVDLRRARWMVRFSDRRAVKLKAVKRNEERVCLQFEHPSFHPSLPKCDALENYLSISGKMSEESARDLGRDLLYIITGLNHGVTHWGFIDPSMVFVSPLGRVTSLLPLGAILSRNGVKAVAMNVMDRACQLMKPDSLPPEVKKAAITGSGWQSIAQEHYRSTDSFAVASLVLEALSDQSLKIPSYARKITQVSEVLSTTANDFLKKALFEDPAWRLAGEEAIAHPWLLAGGRARAAAADPRQYSIRWKV